MCQISPSKKKPILKKQIYSPYCCDQIENYHQCFLGCVICFQINHLLCKNLDMIKIDLVKMEKSVLTIWGIKICAFVAVVLSCEGSISTLVSRFFVGSFILNVDSSSFFASKSNIFFHLEIGSEIGENGILIFSFLIDKLTSKM